MAAVDAFPLVVPLTMYLCGGGVGFYTVLKWFLSILTISSFTFALIGLNAGEEYPGHSSLCHRHLILLSYFSMALRLGHHHLESVHEMDSIR